MYPKEIDRASLGTHVFKILVFDLVHIFNSIKLDEKGCPIFRTDTNNLTVLN